MSEIKVRIIGSWLALGLLSSPCVSAGMDLGKLAVDRYFKPVVP